jgi:hypothetical protein
MSNHKEHHMAGRIKKIAMALAALAALAFGGAQIAQGAGNGSSAATPTPKAESTAPDTDNVQSGDQSAPDGTDPADGPEAPGSEKPGSEAPGSETPNDDGPGGHADEPSNPNANHEATGAE